MTTPIQPASSARLQLTAGMELLEEWSQDADELAKTAVYEVLFSVTEASVFSNHAVVDDVEHPTEFFVLTRRNLVVKIQVLSLGACAILYIGPAVGAPGLDRAAPDPASPS